MFKFLTTICFAMLTACGDEEKDTSEEIAEDTAPQEEVAEEEDSAE